MDCRTLLQIVSEKEPDAAVSRALSVGFEWWWPNGAKLMIPLLVVGIGMNAYSFVISRKFSWLLSMGAHVSIAAWTSLAMGAVIKTLMSAASSNLSPVQLQESIRSFSNLHFVRIAIAGVGVLAGNSALVSSI